MAKQMVFEADARDAIRRYDSHVVWSTIKFSTTVPLGAVDTTGFPDGNHNIIALLTTPASGVWTS